MMGYLSVLLICTLGSVFAFTRGAPDLNVYYVAFQLVFQGHGMEIYQNSPDRFLYAPGFAWLLAPLSLLPKDAVLALSCLLKTSILLSLAKYAATAFPPLKKHWLFIFAPWLVARPVLIDFQYGQVNLLILGAAVWALRAHLEQKRGVAAWFVLGFMAASKLYALPLLLIPWLSRRQTAAGKAQLKWQRAASTVAVVLTLSVPAFTVGLPGALQLIKEWKQALVLRGLPTDSHNQSFAALLLHYFSGEPTRVISLAQELFLGWPLLSTKAIDALTLAWTTLMLGALMVWILRIKFQNKDWMLLPAHQLHWLAMAIGLLFVPSHLVWKPYFCLGAPLSYVAAATAQGSRLKTAFLFVAFALTNLTGFDFIGHYWAARLEPASLMLFSHGILIILALMEKRPYASLSSRSC